MCLAIRYPLPNGKSSDTYFPNPKALLALRTRDGESHQVGWGRREEQSGQLPPGGWARHESILKGVWNRYEPSPVKILAHAFAERNNEGEIMWFSLNEGQWVQGLLARMGSEVRVYVVTVPPPQDLRGFKRWPRLVESI